MDILDDMGVSKSSAKFFLKVNYSRYLPPKRVWNIKIPSGIPCWFAVDLCADCDCAVWGQALQLCPSQYGAMAVVPLRGSWRAAVGSGRRVRIKEPLRRANSVWLKVLNISSSLRSSKFSQIWHFIAQKNSN